MRDVFEGVSDETLVAEAKQFYAEADKIEKEADSLKERASNEKWAVADRMVALNERGWSQVRIADEIQVSRRTAQRYLAMGARYRAPSGRPSFTEAYAEIDGSAGKDATYERHAAAFVQQASPEKVAAVLKQAPAQTQAAVVVESGASEGVQEVIGMSDDKTLAVIEGASASSKVNLESKGVGGKKPKKKKPVEEVNAGGGTIAALSEMRCSLEVMGACHTLVEWAQRLPDSELLTDTIALVEETIGRIQVIREGNPTQDDWDALNDLLAQHSGGGE